MWFVLVLGMAYAGVYTLFIKTDWYVKVIALWSLALCFLCGSPLEALTSYASIIICCYLYILCTKIKDWTVIWKSLQALLFLNVILVVMQATGHDTLLNFGLGHSLTGYGIIGQHMQMGSFSIVLSAVLLPFSLWNLLFPFFIAFFCNSAWTLLTAGLGVFLLIRSISVKGARIFGIVALGAALIYALYTGKIDSNFGPENGRWTVWMQSLKWAWKHPWVGWGAGTYKLLFPSFYVMPQHEIPYKTAHNWIIQMIFEMGYPFTIFMIGLIWNLGIKLYERRKVFCLIGLVMILCDAEVHFPDRMLQTVGIIICFLAYCSRQAREHIVK